MYRHTAVGQALDFAVPVHGISFGQEEPFLVHFGQRGHRESLALGPVANLVEPLVVLSVLLVQLLQVREHLGAHFGGGVSRYICRLHFSLNFLI